MRKSLILTCVIYFLLYSLLMFLVYNAVNYFVYNWMNSAFPSMDNLLEYKQELQEDNFLDIPLTRSSQCSFIVFDDEGRTVYATSKEVADNINAKDLLLIKDYYGNYTYLVFEKNGSDGKTYYYVYLNKREEDTQTAQVIESSVLDENLHVIEGDLIAGKESLSEKEFGFIQGQYGENQMIEKYHYQTSDGKNRTVVLISLQINAQTYDKTLNSANRLWLITIPIVVLLAIVVTLLVIRRIKTSILPLNHAIASYRGDNQFEVNKAAIPMEFESTVDRFSELVMRLENTQLEKEQAYQEKQRIIADISHDVKTPLTVIQGYSKALLEERVPEEKKQKYLETIYKRSKLAVGLMDSLFEYVKMEHPGFEPNRKNVDICELIRGILAEKYNEIEQRSFSLNVDIQEDPIYFMADEKLFRVF